ncbi:MAG: sterol desaturase family protein [Candidatus Poseidoniaceae archaeon]
MEDEGVGFKTRLVSMVLRILTLLLIAGALYISVEGIFVVLLLFVLVVPFEKLFPRHKGQKIRRPHLDTDIGYALASPLLGLLTGFVAIVVGILSLAWIPGLLLRPYVETIPEQYMPIFGILLFDALVYWTHRFYHEIPVLWKFHAIHHSTEHLDWASGFRGHPLDGTILAPAFVFLISAGFSFELTGALAAAQLILGLFLHANVRWRMKWLHRLIITPEFHHWHHTNERDAIWTNYSTFLPIWDQLFGTYFMPKNRRPNTYGVNEEIPVGILRQLRYPLKAWRNPLWYLIHPFQSIKRTLKFAWNILKSMRKSMFRKRGSKPWDVYPIEPN